MNYRILYDLDRRLCFIGDTWHNHTQHRYWSQFRPSELVSLEHALVQSPDWWQQRQFMCAVTNVAFKKQVVDAVSFQNPAWFSVVENSSGICHNVQIGKNTLINFHNVIYDGTEIGDHVTLTNFLMLSHQVKVADMCHISPYTYLCYTTLMPGVCVGLRSSFPGKPSDPIQIAAWSNLLMDSRVTKTIDASGTFFGNRQRDTLTSLQVKIL